MMNLQSLLHLGSGHPSDRVHKAAQAGEVDKVMSLVTQHPQLLSVDQAQPRGSREGGNDGFTLLHEAVSFGHEALVTALLSHDKGAASKQLLDARDAKGRTPVHWAARMRGGNNMLRAMLESGASRRSLIAQGDPAGRLPIHYAAHYGNTEQTSLLVAEGGALVVGAQDTEGDTALHEASREGHVEVVRVLLQDPSYAVVVSVPNALGQLPLHMAAMGGHRDVMLLLLHHAHTHANLAKTTLLATADQKGKTCAHYAAVGGHMSVLAVLANLLGPSAFTAQDEYQRQPLYYAAAEGHAVVAQYMVARGGLDMVGHADKDNLRPSAAAPTELKALLQQMERWLEVEGEAKTKDDQISKGIFCATSTTSESRSKQWQTSALRRSMVEELGELIGQRNGPAVAKIAEQHPRVLFEANAYGVVPLMTAAFHGDLPACQAMVQVGGEKLLLHQSDDGETALHVATSQDHEEVALWMAAQGGKPLLEKQAQDGQTALHYAAERNYVGLATGLLDIGGAGLLSLRDHNQRTPLECTRNASMKAALEEKASQLAQKEQQEEEQRRLGADGAASPGGRRGSGARRGSLSSEANPTSPGAVPNSGRRKSRGSIQILPASLVSLIGGAAYASHPTEPSPSGTPVNGHMKSPEESLSSTARSRPSSTA